MAPRWADARFASTKPVREVREAEAREAIEETEEIEETEATEEPDLPAVDPLPLSLSLLVPRTCSYAGAAPARKPSITRPESVAVAWLVVYRRTSVRGDRTERRRSARWHP
jgi:hypothetical protein